MIEDATPSTKLNEVGLFVELMHAIKTGIYSKKVQIEYRYFE